MARNKIVFHDRQDIDGNWMSMRESYDIPYYNMPDSERTAIRLYEIEEDNLEPRPWQTERNLCKGGDPLKWPGKWKQTLDENMYMPTETMGNYAIHNTVMTDISQLNHNLSKTQESNLLFLAAHGDQAARNRVVEAHLSLAYKIAATQKKAFKRLEFTEMLAIAFATVVDQVDRVVTKISEGIMNHKRIYTVIHQPIIFAIKERGSRQVITIGNQKFRDNRLINATVKDLFLELLRIPEKDEVIEALGWGELRYDNTKYAMSNSSHVVSYDTKGEDSLQVWDEHIGRTRDYNLEELVDWALDNVLAPKEAEIIATDYGIGEDKLPYKKLVSLNEKHDLVIVLVELNEKVKLKLKEFLKKKYYKILKKSSMIFKKITLINTAHQAN